MNTHHTPRFLLPPGAVAAGLGALMASLMSFAAAGADVLYRGQLGRQPIELFGRFEHEYVQAGYLYTRHDTPIVLRGRIADGVAELEELNVAGQPSARIRLTDFDPGAEAWQGEWQSIEGGRRLPIRLSRVFSIEASKDNTFEYSYPQLASLDDRYFRLSVSRVGADYYPRVRAIEIFRKGSDELLQTLQVDTEFRGVSSLRVGDYNFDEWPDLSLFAASHAGPNTTSVFFLQGEDGLFELAEFHGTSLEFDADEKLVHERNSCCAGRLFMHATHRVVGKQLELVERRCWEYDEALDDHVERSC